MRAKIIIIFCIVVLIIVLFFIFIGNKKLVTFSPKKSDTVVVNPYMGLAPPANNVSYTQPHSLVYASLSWRELEPTKGVYDFATFEKKNNFYYWKKQHVKFVFRIILDYPQKEKHKDIPDWLYEEMNEDGTWYEHEWGNGFSPNYANKTLIDAHEKLMQQLAKRYNNDSEIAFIELGSIGHWGEWHTLQQDGIYIPFPKETITNIYTNHYVQYFNHKILLMRRPMQIALDKQMGLFNDMFGSDSDTKEFNKWIQEGYQSWLTKENNPAMPDFWKYAPSGGEFTFSDSWDTYFSDDNLPKTMEQLQAIHVSWLGPNIPVDSQEGLQDNLHTFLKKIGYHFSIVKETHPRKVKRGSEFPIEMEWENSGVAPFYFPWLLEISLADTEGKIVYTQKVHTDVREWLPGHFSIKENISLPANFSPDKYKICVAILDPEKMMAGINLEIEGKREDGRYTLGKIIVE